MVITVVVVVPSLVALGAYPTALSVKATIPLFPTWYAPCPWSLWRQSCPSLSSVLCGLGVEMGCTRSKLKTERTFLYCSTKTLKLLVV